MLAVDLASVTKLYGATRALAGVTLSLAPGRICALLGANGSGKSTLVGIVSTLARPSSGAVTFHANGEKLDARAARAKIGLLSHESFVYGELNAVENLLFWGKLYDVVDAPERAAALLDQIGLQAAARLRPARTYSRGMLQRVALCRTLLHDPSVLLLDEPFTGLDAEGVAAVTQALSAAQRSGKTILVVTHDVEPVGGLCKQVVVLDRGKVVVDETRETPFDRAAIEKLRQSAKVAQSA